MRYYKIEQNGELIGAEAYEAPDFVGINRKGIQIRCSEYSARGIIIFNGSTIAQLKNAESIGPTEYAATEIYGTEYQQIIDDYTAEPPEAPEPDETDTEDAPVVMSDAELRAAVNSMRGKIDLLEGAILELSETLYA